MDKLLPYQRRFVELALAAEAKPNITHRRSSSSYTGGAKCVYLSVSKSAPSVDVRCIFLDDLAGEPSCESVGGSDGR